LVLEEFFKQFDWAKLAFFALFAVGHVVRLVKQAQVTVGTHQIPMSLSIVALIIAAILSIWLWRLSSARP